jgi:hypothetical protein
MPGRSPADTSLPAENSNSRFPLPKLFDSRSKLFKIERVRTLHGRLSDQQSDRERLVRGHKAFWIRAEPLVDSLSLPPPCPFLQDISGHSGQDAWSLRSLDSRRGVKRQGC